MRNANSIPQHAAPGALPTDVDQWDTLAYPGERNINDKTGKERTFAEFDRYPIQKGETPKQYGERLKKIHEKTEGYLTDQRAITDQNGERTERYLQSKQGMAELQAEAEYDALERKLEQAVADGKLTREQADRRLEYKLKKINTEIEGIRQDYDDRQTAIGTPEERARYDEWLKSHEAENLENLARTGRLSVEQNPDSNPNPNTPDNNPNPDNPNPNPDNSNPDNNNPDQDPDNNPDSDPNNNPDSDPNQDPDNPDNDPNDPNDPNNPTDDTEPIEKAKKRNEVDDVRREQELLLELKHSRADLAEAYAKSRRLFGKNRADFIELKEEHSAKLNEFLRLRAKRTYNAEMDSLAQNFKQEYERLCSKVERDVAEYAKGENITEEQKEAKKAELLEEADRQLKEWLDHAQESVEMGVNCRFNNDLVNEAARLEDATIEALDNGTIFRKAVSKIINNKKLRLAMGVAAGVGLAMTGFGLATGAMTIGYSLTAAGAAAGAAKGALSGLVMSRQDSKTSAVRGFVDERQIRHEIFGIKAAEEGSDTANVADWLMDQYEIANDDDASGNAKRSKISAVLGGALGALASGIHLEKVSTSKTNLKIAIPEEHTTTKQIQVGATPEHWDIDLGKVNIRSDNDGMTTTFTQLGGDPSRTAEATEIAWTFDSKYGLVPGSNGAAPGFNGEIGKYAHTYAGRIEDWPEVARSYISEVAEEWAKRGLIPGVKTGGEPIYNTITKTSIDFTTKNLPPITVGTARNTISDTIASMVSGAVVGGTASAVGNREDQTLEEKDPEEVLHFNTQPTPVAPEQPQSTEAEQSAEREENAAKEALRHEVLSIINQIPGINAEGIRILTDQGELDDAKRQRIEQWLNDFSQRPENQDAMAALTSYLESRNSDNDRHAYALRQYFNMV